LEEPSGCLRQSLIWLRPGYQAAIRGYHAAVREDTAMEFAAARALVLNRPGRG